jgi:CBS domain-containing protein
MKTVADVMTTQPACCTPESAVVEAARLMRDHDCGVVPVVESMETRRLVGVVTDRDIVVRLVAEGRSLPEAVVRDCLTAQVRTLPPDATLEACRRTMEQSGIRRVPIVDGSGKIVGIVALADVAEEIPEAELGRTLTEVSEPDSRQLYSEVNEDTRAGAHITPVDDPVAQRAIVPPT